nr:hypothetical protein [Tanacetum cinerariifolium]
GQQLAGRQREGHVEGARAGGGVQGFGEVKVHHERRAASFLAVHQRPSQNTAEGKIQAQPQLVTQKPPHRRAVAKRQ